MAIDDWMKIRRLYQLKQVYRDAKVNDRQESSAEHTWSAMVLTDYLMDNMKLKLDKIKVLELLMYHDVVEIISGDVSFESVEHRKNKEKEEKKAALQLKTEIPQELSEKFYALFKEFEEQKTQEARFAKAIDRIDAEIHELDYKIRWKGWTEERLSKIVSHHLKGFPEVEKIFKEMMQYATENGYFEQ